MEALVEGAEEIDGPAFRISQGAEGVVKNEIVRAGEGLNDLTDVAEVEFNTVEACLVASVGAQGENDRVVGKELETAFEGRGFVFDAVDVQGKVAGDVEGGAAVHAEAKAYIEEVKGALCATFRESGGQDVFVPGFGSGAIERVIGFTHHRVAEGEAAVVGTDRIRNHPWTGRRLLSCFSWCRFRVRQRRPRRRRWP